MASSSLRRSDSAEAGRVSRTLTREDQECREDRHRSGDGYCVRGQSAYNDIMKAQRLLVLALSATLNSETAATAQTSLTGRTITQLSVGDYVWPRFSPSGRWELRR